MRTLDAFELAYIDCALWTTTDDDGDPIDHMNWQDIDPATLAQMVEDCQGFRALIAEGPYPEAIDGNEIRAAHDFWLTRNGHGAGFWDGDWPEHGAWLTDLSKTFGSFDLYLGDDEKVYGG